MCRASLVSALLSQLQAESEAAAAKVPATGWESVQRCKDISTRQAKHIPWQAQAGPPKSTSFTYDNIVTVIIVIIITTIIIALHKPP